MLSDDESGKTVSSVPAMSFAGWLFESGRRPWRLAALAFVVLNPFISFKPVEAPIQTIVGRLIPSATTNPQTLSYLANLVVIAVFTMLLVRGVRKSPGDEGANRALERFEIAWHILWFSWFGYYLVRVLTELGGFLPGLQEHAPALRLAFVLITDACFVLCYIALLFPDRAADRYWVPVSVVAGLVALTGLCLLYSQGMNRIDHDKTVFMYYVVVGVVETVAMAAMVGRLESRAIKPGLIVSLLLYFYAALQVPAHMFATYKKMLPPNSLDRFHKAIVGDVWWATSEPLPGSFATMSGTVFSICALLKGILFLYVMWLRRSGVLAFYMIWMRHQSGEKSPFISPYSTIDAAKAAFLRSLDRRQSEP